MKMKKIFALPVLLLTGAFAMVSCSDDNDSNPILVQPTTFTINEIAEAQGQVDLKQSSTINMTWSQPKFTEPNAPVIPTYSILVSSNGTFNKAYDDKADDNTGADYVQLGETYNTCSANIPTASINKALLQLNQWTEETLPATQTVSIRVMADIRDASKRIYYPILSDNAITLKTVPYYIELVAADPEVWYLIGGDIGDGAWGNNIPSSLPMQTVKDYVYDTNTGKGEITWTGYLAGNGFKLKKLTTSWDEQWGQGGSFGNFVMNDGGSGDIKVPAAGYYTVTLNTANNTLSVEPYDGTPTEFTGMAVSGSFNNWGDTEMEKVHTYAGAKNHDWMITIDMKAGDEIKFKQLGSWDFNKGGAFITYSKGFYAYGIDGGANIVIPEDGKYLILFNDITGYFHFIKQ